MQTCSICLVNKSNTEFYSRKGVRTGLRRDCKQCAISRSLARYEATSAMCRERVSRYRKANPEKVAAVKAKWFKENREKVGAASRRWEKAHPERVRELDAIRRKNNPERCSEKSAKWAKANRAKCIAILASYRSKKLSATPAWADLAEVKKFYDVAVLKTAETGLPHHVDHVVPLQHPLVQGLHNEFNLQVLPRSENMRKGNRYWPDMPELEMRL